jgi:dipeptidase
MGQLTERYGFYGESPFATELRTLQQEGGEAITVVDKEEAWMFHVTSDPSGKVDRHNTPRLPSRYNKPLVAFFPSRYNKHLSRLVITNTFSPSRSTTKSSLWAAQRVPEGHVAAATNQFVLREIDLTDGDNFMGSSNLAAVRKAQGVWNKDQSAVVPYEGPDDAPVDWLFSFGVAFPKPKSHYFNRRRWQIFHLLNPSIVLNPDTDGFASEYPFSIPPLQKLTDQDFIKVNRDHYEGTRYDLTQGPQGGPFGDPSRYDGHVSDDLTQDELRSGLFERSISLFRTSYSLVGKSRSGLPEVVATKVINPIPKPKPNPNPINPIKPRP